MFDFLKNERRDTMVCVTVVTSGMVSASLVRMFADPESVQLPVVVFSTEEIVPTRHDRDPEALELLIEAAMRRVLEKCRTFDSAIDAFHCVVGEPWEISRTRIIHMARDKAFKITQKTIDESIARETRLFEQEISREFGERESMGLMGNSRPAIDINGYRTEKYQGAMAKSLDIHVTFSLAPAGFLEIILGAYVDVFHRAPVLFTGMGSVKTELVRDIAQATILDIGGETSVITIMDRGVVLCTATVPSGLSQITRMLAKQFDVQEREVASVMRFASDENLLEHERDLYYARIVAAYGDFGAVLEKSMIHLKKQYHTVPQPLVIMSHAPWVAALQSLLQFSLNAPCQVVNHDYYENRVVYSHQAPARSLAMTLAILALARNDENGDRI